MNQLYAIDTMQSVCLKEAGVNATDPLAGEATLIQLIFGGYLRSKHNPQVENSRQQHSLGLLQPFRQLIQAQQQHHHQTALDVAPKEEIFVPHTDAMSTSLQWIMANLVKHQDVQAKLVEEIDRVVGDGREDIEEEDLQWMSYLKAVIILEKSKELLNYRSLEMSY